VQCRQAVQIELKRSACHFKGTKHDIFLYQFFHESTPNRPLVNVKNSFIFFRELAKIFVNEVGLSVKNQKYFLTYHIFNVFSSKSRVVLITHG
jgi:hypothetical protein